MPAEFHTSASTASLLGCAGESYHFQGLRRLSLTAVFVAGPLPDKVK